MADLPLPKNERDIGECIYCGTDRSLGKEHAIPYGLNGPWLLLRASCLSCANVTHRFERDTLRCLLPSVRAVLAMQTRRPKLRPKTQELVLQKNSLQRTIQVCTGDFPLYLPTPLFPPPGCLKGAPRAELIQTRLKFLHVAGPSFEQVMHKYDAEFAGARLNFSPSDFARTLAKIAFTATVFALGLKPFTNTPIRQIILGKDPSMSHWIGSWTGEQVKEARGLHAMKVLANGTRIEVVLRLFAQFHAPEYHIVLGHADPDFVNSVAWPWK